MRGHFFAKVFGFPLVDEIFDEYACLSVSTLVAFLPVFRYSKEYFSERTLSDVLLARFEPLADLQYLRHALSVACFGSRVKLFPKLTKLLHLIETKGLLLLGLSHLSF